MVLGFSIDCCVLERIFHQSSPCAIKSPVALNCSALIFRWTLRVSKPIRTGKRPSLRNTFSASWGVVTQTTGGRPGKKSRPIRPYVLTWCRFMSTWRLGGIFMPAIHYQTSMLTFNSFVNPKIKELPTKGKNCHVVPMRGHRLGPGISLKGFALAHSTSPVDGVCCLSAAIETFERL